VATARTALDQKFAVQLMRTSYEVADELDFVAMDEFQKRFYLFRQDEWLSYKDRVQRFMTQGDLANPDYFDYISFCQYAVIGDSMRSGRLEFIEKIGAEGEQRTVRRAEGLRDNNLLPREHERRVGALLLSHLIERFPGRFPLLEGINARSSADLCGGVEQALRCMAICGYGTQWTVLPEASIGSDDIVPRLRLTISGSSLPTAWGQKRLARDAERFPGLPVNDFEVKVARAWLQRQGVASRLLRTTFLRDADVIHSIELINA